MPDVFRKTGEGPYVSVLWARYADENGNPCIKVRAKLGRYTKKEMEEMYKSNPRSKVASVEFAHKVLCIYRGNYLHHTPFHAFVVLGLDELIEELLATAFEEVENKRPSRRRR